MLPHYLFSEQPPIPLNRECAAPPHAVCYCCKAHKTSEHAIINFGFKKKMEISTSDHEQLSQS